MFTRNMPLLSVFHLNNTSVNVYHFYRMLYVLYIVSYHYVCWSDIRKVGRVGIKLMIDRRDAWKKEV